MGVLDPLREKLNTINPVMEALSEVDEEIEVEDEISMGSAIYGDDDDTVIDPELDVDLGEDEDEWSGTFMDEED